MIKRNTKLFGRNHENGFTILELMFVIAIFGIMSTVVLFGFRDFGLKTTFDNLAQDIALHIVQAQKSAISGSVSLTTLGTFAPTRGIHFTSGTTPSPADQEFIYFNDIGLVPNGKYDSTPGCGSSGTECISSTKITTGEYVSMISYVWPGSSYIPVAAGSTVDITFTRPFPDAKINICLPSGVSCYPPVQNVYIELATTRDPTLKKTIVVNGLGEVRVYNGSTACAYSGGSGC